MVIVGLKLSVSPKKVLKKSCKDTHRLYMIGDEEIGHEIGKEFERVRGDKMFCTRTIMCDLE